MNELIAIVGPTAVGKTELAVAWAQRINGEIVSADSRQIYRKMNIGTAKPSATEQARAPHHLIDIRDPDQSFSLAEFQDLALAAIADIQARGRRTVARRRYRSISSGRVGGMAGTACSAPT
ncbi:MAG: hypothetical protein KatS3mg055_2443 [Chloroflexus sp.]|nr:MAG: hypothetical protein KatS3mg055_2443 [Chloroflexus sp.]